MQRLRNITASCIRSKHQARHTRAVTELSSVGPLLDIGWRHMVIPPAPVIPSNEDYRLVPQTALDYRIHLIHCPLHAVRHVVAGMLTLEMRCIHPGYGWQLPGRSICGELLRRDSRLAVLELGDVGKGKSPIIPPGEPRRLKVGWQRRQTE